MHWTEHLVFSKHSSTFNITMLLIFNIHTTLIVLTSSFRKPFYFFKFKIKFSRNKTILFFFENEVSCVFSVNAHNDFWNHYFVFNVIKNRKKVGGTQRIIIFHNVEQIPQIKYILYQKNHNICTKYHFW